MLKHKKPRKKEIESKILDILNLVESISEIFPKDFESFKYDLVIRDASYKRVESAIQNLIDICYMINSDFRFGIPDEEEDVMDNMETNKVLSKKAILILKEMKSFRNILVHKYGKIDDLRAFESIEEGLNDFELVIEEIERFLKIQK